MSDVKTYVKIGNDEVDVADLKQPLPIRDFRDAWQLNGDVITVDPAKAQQVAKQKLRQERRARMETLDQKWMMALGKKDQVRADALEAKRQQLRDVTADARLNSTKPDELKTAIDTIVNEMDTAAGA